MSMKITAIWWLFVAVTNILWWVSLFFTHQDTRLLTVNAASCATMTVVTYINFLIAVWLPLRIRYIRDSTDE